VSRISGRIAMQDATMPGEHLQVERLIEAKLVTHLRKLLRCCAGVGAAAGSPGTARSPRTTSAAAQRARISSRRR
jgi:hypothetical protein